MHRLFGMNVTKIDIFDSEVKMEEAMKFRRAREWVRERDNKTWRECDRIDGREGKKEEKLKRRPKKMWTWAVYFIIIRVVCSCDAYAHVRMNENNNNNSKNAIIKFMGKGSCQLGRNHIVSLKNWTHRSDPRKKKPLENWKAFLWWNGCTV